MRVANPIYDVVFKYLLDDLKIAKLIISKIIGEEIESIKLNPRELCTKVKSNLTNFTVMRIDFSAIIRKPNGAKKLVIIEIQKAKLSTDIMRFRRYLGSQYSDNNNKYVDEYGKTKALPIKAIYFLGHKLEYTKSPVVRITREYTDAATQETIKDTEDFIESLSHDSFVIQIPYLKEKRRNDLEIILGIFDQTNRVGTSSHYLDLLESNFPEKYKYILRRLVKAGSEKEICDIMDVEDDIIEELADLERTIERHVKALETKDKALETKDKALETKDKMLETKDKALETKDKALETKDKALETKDKEIKKLMTLLKNNGDLNL